MKKSEQFVVLLVIIYRCNSCQVLIFSQHGAVLILFVICIFPLVVEIDLTCGWSTVPMIKCVPSSAVSDDTDRRSAGSLLMSLDVEPPSSYVGDTCDNRRSMPACVLSVVFLPSGMTRG